MAFIGAGPRGFEPRSTVLETAILPLNYRPLCAPIVRKKEEKGKLYTRDFFREELVDSVGNGIGVMGIYPDDRGITF